MELNFKKSPDGLLPVIVQDAATQLVLMLGFMNEEALERTTESGTVTFYSRTKKRLWVKGETSGNFLLVKEVMMDCDADTILIKANPAGPVCHTGQDTCFGEVNEMPFLSRLEEIIEERKHTVNEASYIRHLFDRGTAKIAQKVGEEAVEVVIEAMGSDDEAFRNEAADLLFHYLILLQAKGMSLGDITEVLRRRHTMQR